MSIDLRLGDWRVVLADVSEVDAVITDPPFSDRTARGFRGGCRGVDKYGSLSEGIKYGHITEQDVAEFADFWQPRCRWWLVVFTDHVLVPVFERELSRVGLFTFAPLAWCKKDGPPRFMGDGPASSVEWIVVARPRHVMPKERIGSRRGWYATNIAREAKSDTHGVVGSKPLELIEALLREYTLPGDLVCDPFSGTGTTARACDRLGRSFVGAEINPETHALAMRRIAGGVQQELAL